MASTASSQLAALCAILSFLWLSSSIQNHPLVDRPRLSSSLILAISGLLVYAASYAALYLPGPNGRFDDDLTLPSRKDKSPHSHSHSPSLPKRPRVYFLPAIILSLVLRLELFHTVNLSLQCSLPGVESFLPLLLALYESLPNRSLRLSSSSKPDTDDDGFSTPLEDLDGWAETSAPMRLVSALVLCYGAWRVGSGGVRSSVICSAADRISGVFWAQIGGLVMDAVIVIVLWRILVWGRTTRERLRGLGRMLVLGAVATGVAARLGDGEGDDDGMALGSLFVFDVIADGGTFALFCVSGALVVCEGNPSALGGMLAFFAAAVRAVGDVRDGNTWEGSVREGGGVTALYVLCLGFAAFMYASGLRSVVFVKRVFFIGLLVAGMVVATVVALAKGKGSYGAHPLEKTVYDARIESDRWLVHAGVSRTLKIAVQEYRERNHGRDPPPRFDVWWKFATERESPVVDMFEQIGRDVLPFWGLAPEKIREGIKAAAKLEDVAVVTVKNGVASHGHFIDSPYRHVLDEFVGLLRGFERHLADMEIVVNLNERPRVLAPWDSVQRYRQAGMGHGLRNLKLLSRRSGGGDRGKAAVKRTNEDGHANDHISVRHFRQMTAATCSPGSKGRSGVHWNIRDFCSACARPQSEGLFPKNWDVSLDLCHQPDLARLHGFHITPPKLRPVQQLVPVFSRAKTSSYSDFLIPLRYWEDIPEDEEGSQFMMKSDQLSWRGKISGEAVGHELMHGGHQERLVHMVNNASVGDTAIVILPSDDKWKKYRYEVAPVTDLNKVLGVDVGIGGYVGCKDHEEACRLARREFGEKEDVSALKSRYVLLADGDEGPSRGLLPALRSTSVPFVASIFREWYTERLIPWVHFVPVDLRYQGLFSTLSYFTGLKGRGDINGRDPEMEAKVNDALWIADQGKRWAGKAMRREDMEIYLFRLLLEYGRVIDDKRDEIGFVLT